MEEIDSNKNLNLNPPNINYAPFLKRHLKVVLIMSLTILCLITMIFIYYSKSKNKDILLDTSKWETYTSGLYGFEFKYPADEYKVQSGSGEPLELGEFDKNSKSFLLLKEGGSIPFFIFSKEFTGKDDFLSTFNECGATVSEIENPNGVKMELYSGSNCKGLNGVVIELENDYLYSYVQSEINIPIFNTFRFLNNREYLSLDIFPETMGEPENLKLIEPIEEVADKTLRINSGFGYIFKQLDNWEFDYEDSVNLDALIKVLADQKQSIDLTSNLLGNPTGIYIGENEQEYLNKVREHASNWDFNTTNAFTLRNSKNPNVKIRIFADSHDLSDFDKPEQNKKVTQLNLVTTDLQYTIKKFDFGNKDVLTYFGTKSNVLYFRFNPNEVTYDEVSKIISTFEPVDFKGYFLDKISEQSYILHNVPEMSFSIKLKSIFDKYFKPQVDEIITEDGSKIKSITFGISSKYKGMNYSQLDYIGFDNATLNISNQNKSCSSIENLSLNDQKNPQKIISINGVEFKFFNTNTISNTFSSNPKNNKTQNRNSSTFITDHEGKCYFITTGFSYDNDLDIASIQRLLFEDVLKTFKFTK